MVRRNAKWFFEIISATAKQSFNFTITCPSPVKRKFSCRRIYANSACYSSICISEEKNWRTGFPSSNKLTYFAFDWLILSNQRL